MYLREKILSFIFLIFFILIIAKLFYWQIIKGNYLATQARMQQASGQALSASRGNILAKDGSWLAVSDSKWLVFVSKPLLKEPFKKVASELAPFTLEKETPQVELETKLTEEKVRIEKLLNKTSLQWIPIKHKLDNDSKRKIDDLKILGIGFDPEEVRSYPEASSSSHILGFVGKNESGFDVGYFGLEGYYDISLKGKSGYIESEKDAKGIPILIGKSRETPAVKGVDLVTSLDKTIQLIVERKLKAGLEKYGAEKGVVIILNPQNGEILSMASEPSYDPSKYFKFDSNLYRNPAISENFEPGSIFKPIIMASALDAKVIEPDSKCDICGGPVNIDKYTIETWDKKYRPDSTVTDIIVHSDNVGMTFVGEKIGKDKMYDYLDKFGIGSTTGIDLQGEASVPLRKKDTWNDVDLATTSFGQGIAVTPIQVISAIGTIANKGIKIKPRVVTKLTRDSWEQNLEVSLGERIISEKSAQETTIMMVAAVKEGESKWTQAKGFNIAGKTGTAQIPISGHYDNEKTIASFVGFAPADNPKFAMIVTLREPKTSPWGSETAAPLWFSIARELFTYMGIHPEN